MARAGAHRLLAAALVAGCSGPPGAPPPPAAFEWEVALSGLDDSLLSTCARGDQLIVVGGRAGAGLVLEWTGSAWHAPRLPAAGVLWWCWIDERGEVLAVGEGGRVLRGVAGVWSAEDTGGAIGAEPVLYGVWGDSPDDVWVVGGAIGPGEASSLVARRRAGAWQAIADPALPAALLFKVWGSGPADVWVVGDGGAAVRWDGASWTATPTGTDERLVAVWGSGPDLAFAVGGLSGGIVLSWDGAAWARFADLPEPLAAIWLDPGGPLYVGGNRGYLARFAAGAGAVPDPGRLAEAVPVSDVCLHGLIGTGDTVLATGADLFGGGAAGWRGTALTHGGARAGAVVVDPAIDAGPSDAPVPADAAPIDAGPDAALPGAGESCATPPYLCGGDLTCWLLMTSDVLLCTQTCAEASECAAYGEDACCDVPGFQTLETVCIPRGVVECP